MILRGVPFTNEHTPDIDGYTFSLTPMPGTLAFKQATEPVLFLTAKDILEPGRMKLTLRKYFDLFTFYFNGVEIGYWREQTPFKTLSDELFYFFLKPGEKISLLSVTMRRTPFKEMSPQEKRKPLTASIKFKPLDFLFRVSLQQRAVAGINFSIYQFEDVTEFHRDISTLKSQRDQLVSLLKPESGFIGRSPLIMDIRMNLTTVAKSNLTVLIEGETGTGKEILARAIHQAGPRKDKPFVKVDCTAMPENLLESELFGHEKGAFTGAHAQHIGRFEQAQGGTVFLDEVGNLPPQIQAKLLGVLQDFKVQRIGGTRSISLDVHLVTATNVPLKVLIGKGAFREDLFYRLNQFCFSLPPLRERREDIPLLAEFFITEGNLLYNKSVQGLSPEAMDRIYNAPWPGNIRQLRNLLLRAVLFSTGGTLGAAEIKIEESSPEAGPVMARPEKKRGGPRRKSAVKKDVLAQALAKENGNISLAAHGLGMSRFLAYKLLRKFKIRPEKFRR
jgi:transcriptional regulator with GAF, ATPase, and Fis domain